MRTTERSAQGSAFDGTFSDSTGKQRDGRSELVSAHSGYILCNSPDFTIQSIVYSAVILGHSCICCLRDNTNGLWPNLGFEPSERDYILQRSGYYRCLVCANNRLRILSNAFDPRS